MSSDVPNIIRVLSKFLDPKMAKVKNLTNIDDVLKLPIYSCRFIRKNEAKVLNELIGISNIEDASKLDKNNPFEKINKIKPTRDPLEATELQEQLDEKFNLLQEQNPDIEKYVKKLITISKIVASVKEEDEEFKHLAQKIVVIGLDNAGKTAILSKFGGRLGITDLAALKPTKGVDRHFIKTADSELDLFVWDMGGQLKYRNQYLENPEKYFLQIDLLIYVIDVQDSERYAESFEYFDEILEILRFLEEDPFILIYIHKYDPDLRNEPEILLSVELLKDNLNQLLTQYGFDYEAYLTSIYSLISNEPQFSKYIKDVMKSVDSLTNPTLRKVEGLGKTLEETMNAVIRLSESISKQLNDLDTRLRAIESGAFQIAQSGVPIGITNPDQSGAQSRAGDSRSQVLDELKQLFEKKRKLNL